MQADLRGRVALVMGGTKGIGRAIALKFAACGAQVVIQGRDPEAAAALIAAAEGLGGPRVRFIAAEFSSYEAVRQVVDGAAAACGRLDIAVANGGSHWPRPELFHLIPPAHLPGYFDSRLYSRIYTIHAAFAHMQQQGYGKIISITTDAGRVPTPSESMNGAAAAALVFLTRSLGREFARWGVRINCIATTLTQDTPPYATYEQEKAEHPDSVLVKVFDKIAARAPFGLNRPEDLAELALYLAAPESDQLSGATLSLNGGISFPSY